MNIDPNLFVNFTKLKNLVYSGLFNYSNESINFLYKNLKSSSVEQGDWFNLDFTTGGMFESEGKGLDQDVLYIGSGKIAVCHLFRNDIVYQDSTVDKELFEFRQKLQDIGGIQSAQFYHINNIIVLEHIDELPQNNILRMTFPLQIPHNRQYNLFAIKLDLQTIVPEENEIIFFDHKIKHSAWNLTGEDWKFLSFDIEESFLRK